MFVGAIPPWLPHPPAPKTPRVRGAGGGCGGLGVGTLALPLQICINDLDLLLWEFLISDLPKKN